MSLLTHPFSLTSVSAPLYHPRRQVENTETPEELQDRLERLGINPWAGIICNGTQPTYTSFNPPFACPKNEKTTTACRNGSPKLDTFEPDQFDLDNPACKPFCDNWHTGRVFDNLVACLEKRCTDAKEQRGNWVKALEVQPGTNSTRDYCIRRGFTVENATVSPDEEDDKEETDVKDDEKEETDAKDDNKEVADEKDDDKKDTDEKKDGDKDSSAPRGVNWQGTSVLFAIVFGSIMFGSM